MTEDKIDDSWEKLRREERQDRDARIKEDLEQADRISKTIAGEDES